MNSDIDRRSNIKIAKRSSKARNPVEGVDSLPDSHLDVIYVDANHQYEYLLRDMMHARKKLK